MEISKERYEFAIPIIIAFVFVFNILAMLALRRMRTESDHLIRLLLTFIWNTCFSDLLVGAMLIINTVLYKVYRGSDKEDRISDIMEILENLVTRITLTVTAVVLFIVTLIRIMALTKTYFRYRVNRVLVLNINIAIWIVTALLVAAYNCIFEFYFNEAGDEQYQHIFIPLIFVPSVFVLTICHVIILKIIRSHGMSMQTYLETLRTYVSASSLKTKSVRNLFAIAFGINRSSNKTKNKTSDKRNVPRRANSCKDSIIIENNYAGRLADRMKAQKQAEKDKERCKQQVKLLFRTKDISLLRLEVFAFLICWLPLTLVELFHAAGIDGDWWYDYEDMRQYTLLIAFVKSAVTPCIYLMYKKHELFSCLYGRHSARNTQTSTIKSWCSTVTTEM